MISLPKALLAIVAMLGLLSIADSAHASQAAAKATQPVQFTYSITCPCEEAIVTLPKAPAGSWWQVHMALTSNQGGKSRLNWNKTTGSVHLDALLPNQQDTCGVQNPQGACNWTVKVTVFSGPPKHKAYPVFEDTYSA
jgi:hypothetical protein